MSARPPTKRRGTAPVISRYEFLRGGGEMGERIRAFDWARTPLGAPAAWSQSLRTALGILLHSGYPMYIAWGREFIQFYNDAYRPILGATKHPRALGSSTVETFAEIWDFIGPMFNDVLAHGNASTYVDQLLGLNRYGYVEECYFTFSYSAIFDDDGGIGGVMVTVLETTERVLEERRLRTLRDLRGIDTRLGEEAICAAAAAVCAGNRHDLPFALFYRADDALPVAHTLPPDDAALTADYVQRLAALVPPLAPSAPWVSARLPPFAPLATSPWPEAVEQVAAVAIAPAGQERPAVRLIVGLSPRKAFDAKYEQFLQSVAASLAASLTEAEAFAFERRRAEELAELDRAKTAFFSNVSHEFRTPLTLMLGPLEDLLRTGIDNLPASARTNLTLAHRNALRLLKLVNTLLDFSRIEAGRAHAAYQPTELGALTGELASVFRAAVERAGLALTVDCPALAEPVYVDRDMWEKIVFNLISNAFKHTFAGEISVCVASAGRCARLSVSDTGVGIPEEALPHLFERFYRVPNARARTHEGSGIGLALVRELVRLHGGAIAVDSKVDGGSRFTVDIPFGTAHLPAERVGAARRLASTAIAAEAYVEEALRWLPASDAAPVAQATDTERDVAESTLGTVLLVDDNADMRDYLRSLLQRRFRVVTAADGEEALALIARASPDVVLTDIMMPRLDGVALLKAVRENPRTRELPVILLSARAGEEARIEGVDAGADDYLVKPFGARELLARVETHFRLAQTRRRALEQERSSHAAARLAQQRLELVLSSMEERFFVLDAAWRCTFANARAVAATGRAAADIIGRTIWRAVPEYAGTRLQSALEAARQAQAPQRFELAHADDGGWSEVSTYPTGDGIAVLIADITPRKQAEQAQRQMEQRFSGFMQHFPGLAWIKDVSGRFVYANEVAAKAFGCAPAEVPGKTNADVMPAELLAQCDASDRNALTRAGGVETLEQMRTPDGGRRTVLVNKFPIPGHDGAPAFIGGMAIDITERIDAEARLRASEERLRLATQTGKIGLWDWDLLTQRLTWTESLYAIYGLAPEQFEPSAEGFARLVHPTDRPAVEAAIQRALADDAPCELEFRATRADGTTLWLYTNARVIREHGRAVRLLGATLDITERKRMEIALREQEERYRNSFEVAGVSLWEEDFSEVGRYLENLRARGVEDFAAYFAAHPDAVAEALRLVVVRDVNQVTLQTFGAASKAQIIRNLDRLFTADSLAVFKKELLALAAGDRFYTGEAEMQTLQGERRHFLLSVVFPPAPQPLDRVLISLTDMTERKRVETALRESEERFAKAFNASPLVLTLSSLETGKLLEVNETFVRLSGYTREEAIGRTTLELGLWASPADREAELAQVRESGRVRNGEYRFLMRDGREMTGLLSAERIDIGGEACTLTVIQDITERKRAEQLFIESEQRFKRFMQHLPGLAWIKDTAGRYVFANEAACKMLGMASAQLLGKTDEELFPDEIAERFRAQDEQVLANEAGMQSFETLQHADGDVRHALVNKFVIPGADGGRALIGGIAVDVTEEKRKEEALRNSERLYRAIGESIDFGVWVCDPQGRNVYASDSFLRLVGLTQEQCAEFGWGEVLHPDDAPGTLAAWKECARTGTQWDREHRFRGVDGKWHHVLARGVPVRNERGEITAWAGINLDIDRLKHIENELREADRRKNEFLATLAHELRNPLAPIRTGLEILRLARDNPSAMEQARAMMERQLKNMVRLIDDLMDLSRISRGQVELRKERVDLAAAIGSAVETSRPLIEQSNHQLLIDVGAEPLYVEADLTRLAQVFSNLLNNAAKYTPDGGQIRLSARRAGAEIVVSVIDNGIGIPAHMLPAVFEMFTQVERPIERAHGGLGIGLSIVKRLVEMHGGSVAAASDGPGTGSEFTVRLPALPTLDAAPLLGSEHAGAAPARNGCRVLIADDNADSAASLAMMLKLQGNEVRTARDGLEAIEVAAVFRPRLILLDIGMPRLNGYDACRRLREQAHGARALIVAMTGWGQEEDRRQSHEAGFDDHLVKPVDPNELERLLALLQER